MKENKNKIKKDKRALINKAERILLKLLNNPEVIDQKAYDKATSLYRKGTRKKAWKHAQKFGYPGGLQAAIQSIHWVDGTLFDKTNGAYCE
jgi:hypothetical protein